MWRHRAYGERTEASVILLPTRYSDERRVAKGGEKQIAFKENSNLGRSGSISFTHAAKPIIF